LEDFEDNQVARQYVTFPDPIGTLTAGGLMKPLPEDDPSHQIAIRWGTDPWGNSFPYDAKYDENGLLRKRVN
jgi:hypothetical protein